MILVVELHWAIPSTSRDKTLLNYNFNIISYKKPLSSKYNDERGINIQRHLSHLPLSYCELSAGISTYSDKTSDGCRGFIGPVPPPLLMRINDLLNYIYNIILLPICKEGNYFHIYSSLHIYCTCLHIIEFYYITNEYHCHLIFIFILSII